MSSNTNRSGFRFIAGLAAGLAFVSSAAVAQVTAMPAEARKVSAEAYLYGFPVVDSYKTQYAQASHGFPRLLDAGSDEKPAKAEHRTGVRSIA